MFVSFSNLGNYGRLGNQMFQYALIKNVAHKNNCEFKIPKGNYDLLKLNVVKNWLDEKPTTTYKEKFFHYDDEVFNQTNVDFEGYFQSYKYINYDLIKGDFSVDLDGYKKKIELIKGSDELVAIHVRLTDYLKYSRIHPFPGMGYYKKAMSQFSGCKFVIFSDDINFCKRAFVGSNVVFQSNDNIQDLFLMSLCDHNIIANSSFSWWAAYLNSNPHKKVIYPSVWFGPAGPKDWFDISPKDWIKC